MGIHKLTVVNLCILKNINQYPNINKYLLCCASDFFLSVAFFNIFPLVGFLAAFAQTDPDF